METTRVEELLKQLLAGVPDTLGNIRSDLERNFRAVLQGQMQRLDLASRTEFDVQSRLLERARGRIDQLEARVIALETRVRDLETEIPPASD